MAHPFFVQCDNLQSGNLQLGNLQPVDLQVEPQDGWKYHSPTGKHRCVLGLPLACLLVLNCLCLSGCSAAEAISEPAQQSEFSDSRAFGYLKDICRLGPRPSGSEGMLQQQQMIVKHFEKHGAKVERQIFTTRHPENGSPVEMTNLIIRYQPQLAQRIIIGAHYDTRPYPDRDPVNPRGIFLGANDGASGVALFMEMAHVLSVSQLAVGVDLVLFDGEEFLFDDNRDRDRYFLGSKHFAEQVAAGNLPGTYIKGVIVDMVADKYLTIYQEVNSMRYAESLVHEVWAAAKRAKVSEFIPRVRHEIRDDHLPLNEIAKIPTIDIIDFDYPKPGSRDAYWHTTRDVPENCSGASLRKVAEVLMEWLRSQKPMKQ